MIYYALRSPDWYLNKLREVSEYPNNHQIISVIGGLAFLHALGSTTKKLTLVDCESETHSYCRMIISLIRGCESLAEFASMLSGHRAEEGWLKKQRFGEVWDSRKVAARCFKTATERELFERTYGVLRYYPELQQGRIEDNAIKFFGLDMTPLTFNWRFGKGAFASESDFQNLRSVLSVVSIEYIQGRLEEVQVQSQNDQSITVLASNAESPLFTHADKIFQNFWNQKIDYLRYVSWHRDTWIGAMRVMNTDVLAELAKGGATFSMGSRAAQLFKQLEMPVETISDTKELQKNPKYSQGVFVNLDLGNGSLTAEVQELVREISPGFRRLILGGKVVISELISVLERCELQKSYQLIWADYGEDCSFVVWELRGVYSG